MTAIAETAAPSGDMTVTAFYETMFIPWLEELVKTGQKAHTTLVSYKRYWDTYLADHFNGTKTFKNYEPYIGAQFLQNLRRPDDDRPYGLNTIHTFTHLPVESLPGRPNSGTASTIHGVTSKFQACPSSTLNRAKRSPRKKSRR